jgi:hypothetical protein
MMMRQDLSVFRVSAWCSQSDAILTVMNLFIPEATPPEAESPPMKWDLAYPVEISVILGRATTDDILGPLSQRLNKTSFRPPR